jgi:hypothetical protein
MHKYQGFAKNIFDWTFMGEAGQLLPILQHNCSSSRWAASIVLLSY